MCDVRLGPASVPEMRPFAQAHVLIWTESEKVADRGPFGWHTGFIESSHVFAVAVADVFLNYGANPALRGMTRDVVVVCEVCV